MRKAFTGSRMHLTKYNTCYTDKFELFCVPPTLILDHLYFRAIISKISQLYTGLKCQYTEKKKKLRAPTTYKTAISIIDNTTRPGLQWEICQAQFQWPTNLLIGPSSSTCPIRDHNSNAYLGYTWNKEMNLRAPKKGSKVPVVRDSRCNLQCHKTVQFCGQFRQPGSTLFSSLSHRLRLVVWGPPRGPTQVIGAAQ